MGCYCIKNSLLFFNFNLGKKLFEINKEKSNVLNFKFRTDGLVGAFSNVDGYLKILNVKSKKTFKEIKIGNYPIHGLSIL